MSGAPNHPAPGLWVLVCGPSGSGKDSVIGWAQQALQGRADIVFARRYITRPIQPGSDHDPVSTLEFEALVQSGALCWHWHAHGFGYGIAQHYASAVAQGGLVVVNGSREHARALAGSPGVRLVQITADRDALAQRLAARARDSDEAVAHRLQRNERFDGMACDLLIVNDADLAHAGRQLADYLVGGGARAGMHGQA